MEDFYSNLFYLNNETYLKIYDVQALNATTKFCFLSLYFDSITFYPATEGELRLRNGEAPNKGRIEVFHDNHWGTICNGNFDLESANVVCRQLGYPGAAEVKNMAYFGAGTGPSHMLEVDCLGTELRLIDCSAADWIEESCGHEQDVGVVCNSSKKSFLVSLQERLS